MVLISVLPATRLVTCSILRSTNFNICKQFSASHQRIDSSISIGRFSLRRVFDHFCSSKMSGAGIERLQKNAAIAEGLIQEISSKINSLAPSADAELEKIRLANEELRREVEKWTEILTMVEIRRGQEPSYYLSYTTPAENVADEPAPASAAPAEVRSEKYVKGKDGKKPQGENVNAGENKQPAPQQQQPEADVNKNTQESKPKSEKAPKQKAPKGGNPAPAPAVEVIDISRLDLRIGKIVEVDRHPEADALYLEKIDVGEAKPRTVISGLVKHVPLDQMKDRLVVVLCNLKPAKMRGITSEAMVMCASTPDKVEILTPPAGVVPGDVVEFDGYTRNPDPVMNPKKKIFETVAPDLKTNAEKVATYKGVSFTVAGKGVVVAETLADVQIK